MRRRARNARFGFVPRLKETNGTKSLQKCSFKSVCNMLGYPGRRATARRLKKGDSPCPPSPASSQTQSPPSHPKPQCTKMHANARFSQNANFPPPSLTLPPLPSALAILQNEAKCHPVSPPARRRKTNPEKVPKCPRMSPIHQRIPPTPAQLAKLQPLLFLATWLRGYLASHPNQPPPKRAKPRQTTPSHRPCKTNPPPLPPRFIIHPSASPHNTHPP